MELPSNPVKLPDCQLNWDFYRKLTPAKAVTALPSGAVDGQIINFLASSTTGTVWQLLYSSATGKWHYIGGPPLLSLVDTAETTASVVEVDLATVGPTITAPLAGDYQAAWGARMFGGPAAAAQSVQMKIKIGAAAGTFPLDFFTGSAAVGATSVASHNARMVPLIGAGILAGTVIKNTYQVNGATGNYANRWLTLLPIRVG